MNCVESLTKKVTVDTHVVAVVSEEYTKCASVNDEAPTGQNSSRIHKQGCPG